MLMGKKQERFLPACLASIADAVDLLVVNENSCQAENNNLSALKDSALYRQGKVKIIPSEFKGFGYCRNLCLDYLRANPVPGMWVLIVDCDEVHAPGFTVLTRKILPNLPPHIGIVDGYFRHFVLSGRYYVSLDRRHNMLFSFNKDICWEGSVHEKLVNIRGARIGLPYRYFHYGYLAPLGDLMKRWELYGSLGDATSADHTVYPNAILESDAARAMRFKGWHPGYALRLLQTYEDENREAVRHFEEMVNAHNPGRSKMLLKDLNYEIRMAWRGLQFMGRFPLDAELCRGLLDMTGDQLSLRHNSTGT